MEMMQQDDVLALIARELAGIAEKEETEKLREWINQSEVNRLYYLEVRNIWNESDRHTALERISTTDGLEKVMDRLKKKEPLKKIWQIWQKIAAFLLLPLLIGAISLSLLKREKTSSVGNTVYNEVFAAFGTRSSLKLADSTIVWLNSGSSFRYPVQFNSENREVFLKGEAYFEVKSDPLHPFIVNTNGLKVVATGTKFNVFGYESGKVSEVTLVTGRVVVKDGAGSEVITELQPGQHLKFKHDNSEKTITEDDTYKYVAWKDGKLIFRNDPMLDVLNKISLTFNVDFEIHGDKLKDYRYRATFQDESLDQILKLLKISSPLDYTELSRTPLPDGTFPKKKVIIFPVGQP